MLALTRFRTDDPGFPDELRAMCAFWRTRPGCQEMHVVRNIDDPSLWAVVSTWGSVGDYRRSFSGYEAKMALTPVLLRALDEPSAYLDAAELDHPAGLS